MPVDHTRRLTGEARPALANRQLGRALAFVGGAANAGAATADAHRYTGAMSGFTVLRIDHLVLRVQSLERSVAFYRSVLGCDVVRRRDELGLVHLRAGASMIDLVSIDGPLGRRGGAAPGTEGRNVDHLCLRIEPYDEAALLQWLHGRGVPVTETTQKNFGAEGEGPSLYFQDPDANLIELKGPCPA